MATSRTALRQQPSLLSRMAGARFRTDALFDLLPPNSFYELPIAERHRLIFYLGHLEAFDWNSFSGTLNLSSHDEQFDKLSHSGSIPSAAACQRTCPRTGRPFLRWRDTKIASARSWTNVSTKCSPQNQYMNLGRSFNVGAWLVVEVQTVFCRIFRYAWASTSALKERP